MRLGRGVYVRSDLAARLAGRRDLAAGPLGRGESGQARSSRPGRPGRADDLELRDWAGLIGSEERNRKRAERGTRLLQIAAALAVAGPDAVVSHQDAAVVHGLVLLDRPPAGVVFLSRPRGASASRTGGLAS